MAMLRFRHRPMAEKQRAASKIQPGPAAYTSADQLRSVVGCGKKIKQVSSDVPQFPPILHRNDLLGSLQCRHEFALC
jgi:hypothetical protein